MVQISALIVWMVETAAVGVLAWSKDTYALNHGADCCARHPSAPSRPRRPDRSLPEPPPVGLRPRRTLLGSTFRL
eukprot:9504182-Pyramimonas_sp.AAC.3